MYKNLFFDDQRIFQRENTLRSYAEPELIAVYHDTHAATCFQSPYVFRTDDGKYRMLYQGKNAADGITSLFLAVSTDGVRFEPEDVSEKVSLDNRIASGEIMKLPSSEVAYILEDNIHTAEERYKMLLTTHHAETMSQEDTVWTSADMLHWKKSEGVSWHNRGTEPCTGAFYNTARGCFTILCRPFWGNRHIGIIETKDFRTFTDFELCMQCDSEDQPLDEIYGMTGFSYDGWYIGLPYIYGNNKGANHAKYSGGTMKAQLAYSWDGKFWQRSLHMPFLDGEAAYVSRLAGTGYKMVWPASILRKDNCIYLYASATVAEHGTAFVGTTRTDILVFRLREDGFVRLVTKDIQKPSVISTRENIWMDGDVHINLTAKNATVAICEADDKKDVCAHCHAVDGFDHSDCIPFSGDATDWVPTFKSGKTLSMLKGKTVCIEVRMEDGALYAISGDYLPVMNTEAAIYRNFGTLPVCGNLYSK